MAKRIIAIGDIHGCSRALRSLIEKIAPDQDDTIVTLGDYIDRGPDSKGVLEQLILLGQRCLLVPLVGNHEEMFLGAREGKSDLEFWLKFGGKEAPLSYGVADANQIPADHVDFIKKCRRYFETTRHIFVHANYWPNLPLDQQSTTTLFWENLDIQKAHPHYSGKTIIVGHTPQKNGRILDLGFLKCIDTFCHGGGWLTALEVNGGEYWQANEQNNKLIQGRL